MSKISIRTRLTILGACVTAAVGLVATHGWRSRRLFHVHADRLLP